MEPSGNRLADRLEWLGLLAGFALTPALSVYATKATATFLAVSTLLLLAARLMRPQAMPLGAALRRQIWRPLPALLAAFVGWAALSALWSPEPGVSGGYALRLTGSVALGVAWCLLVHDVHGSRIWRLAAAGTAIALLLIGVELAAPPGIRGLIGAEAERFNLNRPVVIAGAMAAFQLILAARHDASRFAALGLCLAAAAIALASESQSAVLFWVVFAAAAAAERMAPKTAPRLFAATAALLLVLLPIVVLTWYPAAKQALAGAAAPALLQQANAALRLEIWHDYTLAARTHPLAGWGIGAERLIETPAASDPSRPLRRHTHPHSFPIQTWVNFGGVGALLGAAILLLAGRALPVRRPERGPGAASLFAAMIALWSVSHGAWQEWWLALIALSLGSLASLGAGGGDGTRQRTDSVSG